MTKKKNNKWFVPLIIVIIALAAGVGIWLGLHHLNTNKDETKDNPAETTEQTIQATSSVEGNVRNPEDTMGKTVFYKGTEYQKKEDITTILFMGVDDTEDANHDHPMSNGGRSDTLILFVLNDAEKTADMLTISRDTITEVDVYDQNGEYAYSGDMQITMQYSFGESRKKSCWLTKRTVSELLYGTDIDGHLSLTMEGISLIVDLMGGLTVTMPEDYTYINEAYTKGAEVTLDGKAAERFVRYRDIEELGSNEGRMDRQTWFLRQVFSKLKKAPSTGELIESLLDKAEKYVETDLSGEQLKALGSYSLVEDPIYLPGEMKEGYHDEFYVDEEALQDLIIELFYEPVQ